MEEGVAGSAGVGGGGVSYSSHICVSLFQREDV